VLFVVPTFRPTQSVVDLVKQIKLTTIVSDDASPVTSDPILREISQLDHVSVIRNHRNRGIARGLNQGLEFAKANGFSWLLTLDQDSSIEIDYPEKIVAAAQSHEQLWTDRASIGVIAPATISDISGPMTYPSTIADGICVTEEVIQSGALWRVSALSQVGGFDESLGIDAVDAAACLRLREAGFLVALTDCVELQHNLGDSHQINILGKTVMITNHSPARRATMVRNRLRLAPAEFKQSPMHAVRTLRRVAVNSVLGGLTGENRWAKIKGSLSGLHSDKSKE
jgi:rhamnosyltransferase